MPPAATIMSRPRTHSNHVLPLPKKRTKRSLIRGAPAPMGSCANSVQMTQSKYTIRPMIHIPSTVLMVST